MGKAIKDKEDLIYYTECTKQYYFARMKKLTQQFRSQPKYKKQLNSWQKRFEEGFGKHRLFPSYFKGWLVYVDSLLTVAYTHKQ
jgi:hypothetical protein